MAVAKLGDTVKVHYEGRFEDGTVFVSSKGREPLEFVVGGDRLIKGLRSAVIGMSEGEKKTVTVSPENAYGVSRPELISEVLRTALPPDLKPEVGMVLTAKSPSGQDFRVKVVGVNEGHVMLDRNHPLAGKVLVFDLELVSAITC